MRRFQLLVVGLVLAGCTFDDSVPAGANIRCQVSEDCPRDWRCAPRLGRCVQRSDVDAVGPTLSGAVTPALVRPGAELTVAITADEPLLGAPEIEVRAGTTVRPVPQSAAEVWTFTVPATEPDGLLTFFGSAEDAAGNGTRGVLLGAARVDGSAPAVVSTRVSPQVVSPSTLTSVVVSLSEDVLPGARLLARSAQGVEVARLEATEGASTLRFEFLPPASVADGDLTLHLEGLVDVAGNAAAATEVGWLTVDGTPPGVGPLGLAGRRYSAQPGFDVVTVPVAVTGASFVQVCLAADCRDAVSASSITFPVVPGADGPRIIRVRARDVAGNTTEVAESVDFDFRAPSLESLEVEPGTIAPGGQVIVSATFDEPLAAGAALVVTQADGGFGARLVSTRAGSRLASFLVRMPQISQASETFGLRLEDLADDVANASGAADAGSFLIDADPPIFPPHDAGFARRYSRQPGHDVVVPPPVPVLGAARVEVCLDSTCVEADGGSVSFPVLAAASEGGHAVTWRAYDAVGNAAILVDTVTFDFTAPRVLSASVGYTPPPGCPLTSVTALTRAGGVAVSLTTDEPLLAVPQVDAGAALAFTSVSGADGGQAFGFAATAPGSLASGSIPVSGWLVDDVGNGALAPVTNIEADTTPPPPVPTALEDGFVYTRIPFGAQRTGYLPRFTVEANSGTFEPDALVQIWNSGSTTTGLLLASLRADAAGALPRSTLAPADLSRVYFKHYDGACNAQPTTPTAVVVPHTDAVLTLGAKEPGQTVINPNRYLEEFGAGPMPGWQTLTREFGASELARADWGQPDGGAARSRTPMLRWQTPAPAKGPYLCASYNRTSGETILATGTRAYRRGSFGWEEAGDMPAELRGNCAVGTIIDGTGVLMTGSSAFNFWDDQERPGVIIVYQPEQSGYVVGRRGGGFFSIDVEGGTWAVYSGDPAYFWDPVTIENPPPSIWVAPSNVASLAGLPVLLDASSAWILVDGTVPGTMRWESLPAPPFSPEAAVELGADDLVIVGAARQTRIFRGATGQWEPGPPHPALTPVVSAYTDADGFPSFLADDWSVAHFDGSTWTTIIPPAPQTSGYRALGHSPLLGTLATQSSPPRVIFHGAYADGGSDVTFSWDGGEWTQLAGPSTASPSGVAATQPDGGVILLGLERGASTLSTFRLDNSAWVKLTNTFPPTPRTRHAMALNRSGRVMVAGGLSMTNQPLVGLSGWSGFFWNGLASGSLSPRSRPAMGYDPLRQVTVLFGGEDSQLLNDTWEYATSFFPRGSPLTPPARAGASLVWDPTYEALVLVGGGVTPDTWVYDGAWRNLTSYSGLAPSAGVAAWDPTTRSIMALSAQGEAFLSPYLPVGHRFFPSLTGISASAITGGSVMAVFPPGPPAGLRYAAYLSTGWTSLGAASSNTAVALDQLAARQIFYYGVRIGPAALDSGTLLVDYFELTLRYR